MPIGLRGTSVGSLNILCHFGHRIAYILVLANQEKFRVLSQFYLAQVKQYFKAQTIPLAACTKIHSGGWWWSCKSFLTVAEKICIKLMQKFSPVLSFPSSKACTCPTWRRSARSSALCRPGADSRTESSRRASTCKEITSVDILDITTDQCGYNCCFFKMGQPQPLLTFIFGLYKQTSLKFLQQIYVKKSI